MFLGLSAKDILHPPPGSFRYELARLETPEGSSVKVMAPPEDRDPAESGQRDLTDFQCELSGGSDEATVADVLDRYKSVRAWIAAARTNPDSHPPGPILLAEATPKEFALYLEGAVEWTTGDDAAARSKWEAVLALPPKQRSNRTTWAQYMLGLYWIKKGQEADRGAGRASFRTAADYFEAVRTSVRAGFRDSLQLAEVSYGREAQCHLAQRDYTSAFHYYLEGYVHGDDSSVRSLYVTAQAAASANRPEDMKAIALDPQSREIVAVFLATDADGITGIDVDSAAWQAQRSAWASAFESAGVTNVRSAGALAWVAYEGGQWSLASRWAALAGEQSPMGQWVQAKLALRGGDQADAERRLSLASQSPLLSADDRALVLAELGRVRLAMDNPMGAFDAWIGGGHWRDAAYVAERLMTIEQLRGYVDHAGVHSGDQMLTSLRSLLARRLARSGSEAAVGYFDHDLGLVYKDYLKALRAGYDASKPAAVRADAFWHAAQTLRENGMDLVGTELEPDFLIFGGDFDIEPAEPARVSLKGDPLGPTPAELARLSKNPAPEKRFHYRYKAAEIALLAASLMPNDSEETARVLCEAGGWIQKRDPKAANPFYVQLVIRCPHTELGRKAAAKHWFPDTAVPSENTGT